MKNSLLSIFLTVVLCTSLVFCFNVALAQNIALPLNCTLTDTVMHPSQPIVYVSDKTNKKLYSINYQTSETKEIVFDLPPERITFANNEIYVCLLKGEHSPYWWEEDQQGAIAIINADSFALIDKFDIALDPYDIVVDNDGFIYISSGSGQSTILNSYNRQTKALVDTESIKEARTIAINPILNKIYSSFMEQYSFSMGTFSNIYYDYNDLNPNFKISPDGKYIFDESGNIYSCSNIRENDMQFYFYLNKTFNDVCFNMADNKFYTATDGKKICSYNYDTFEDIGSFTTNTNVKYMFFSNNTIVTIGETDNAQFVIETIDPASFDEIDARVPVSTALTKTGNMINLNCENVADTAYHTTHSYVYTVDSNNNSIYKIDTENAIETKLTTALAFKPNSVAYYNGELYVGYGVNGAIGIYDAETLEAIDMIMTGCTFFDMTVGHDGYIYIIDESYARSFSRTTKKEVSNIWTTQKGHLVLSPTTNAIYFTSEDVSPSDIYKIVYNNGQFTKTYNSPYHGVYLMSDVNGITPDGKYIINGSGNIFTSSEIQENDIKFFSSINKIFIDICFDAENSKFYTAIEGKKIYSYNNVNFEGISSYMTIGNVKFMNYFNNKIVAISKNDNSQYIIELIDPAAPNPIDPGTPVTTALTRTDNILNLNCDSVTDIAYHPTSPYIYTIDSANQGIYKIDTQNAVEIKLSTTYKPSSISYYNNEIYVGYGEQGFIGIYDAGTLQAKDTILTDATFFDMTVGRDGYIYIIDDNIAKSFSRTTKQEISYIRVSNYGYLQLHPLSNAIYYTSKDLNPSDIYKIVYNNGRFTTTYDSSYHGDYPLGDINVISPDGNYIFNSSGNIFTSSEIEANDIKYSSKLSKSFNDLCFDLGNNRLYTAFGGKQIYSYNSETFEGIRAYTTIGIVKYINYINNSIVAVSKNDSSQYTIEIIDPTSLYQIDPGEPTTTALTETDNKINLNYKYVTDIAYHDTKPYIYTIDKTNKEIYKVDTENAVEIKIATSSQPNSVAYHNGELYVGYGANGEIIIYDAETLEAKDRILTDATFLDMTVGHDGYVYVIEELYAKSFSRTTKQEVSNIFILRNGYLELHPTTNAIYFTTIGLSPSDIHKIVYNNGQFTTTYDSPYHGNYALGDINKVSPDGNYIFNSAGTVFTSSETKANDIIYVNKLKKAFSDISFDAANNRTYNCNTSEKFIRVYNYNDYSITGIIPVNGAVNNLYYKNNKLIALSKVNNQYLLEDLTSSPIIPIELLGINLSVNNNNLDVNDTLQLRPSATYNDDSVVNITTTAEYTSSNTNILTVSSSGLVTAKNYGNATITVNYSNKSTTIDISVMPTLSSISINVPNAILSPAFYRNTKVYKVYLPLGTKTVPTISAIKSNVNSLIEIHQASSLSENATITVTAPDNITVSTYVISFEIQKYLESIHPYTSNNDSVWTYKSENSFGPILEWYEICRV